MNTSMEPLLRDSLADAGEIAQPEPVASLVVGSASPHRTLLHLGKLENGARYAVGIPGSNGVLWHLVGALDLTAIPVDRALLAGVSAMAMRHVREAQIQIGDAVLVFGTDPWALLLAQWALRQGASPLVFAGRVPESLSATLASVQVDAHIQNPTAGDLAKAVKGTHRSAGFATVIDAVASETGGVICPREPTRNRVSCSMPIPICIAGTSRFWRRSHGPWKRSSRGTSCSVWTLLPRAACASTACSNRLPDGALCRA
jgi:hypothetical protein